jgi:hypothetical protein
MNTRKRYLIHKKFQSDFTLKVLTAILFPMVVCTLFIVIYLKTTGWMSGTLPEGGLESTFWFSILLRAVPVAFVILVFSVLFSHRIAGPVRRMQNAFEGLAQGVAIKDLRLRKKDFFHNIANKLNGLNGNKDAQKEQQT